MTDDRTRWNDRWGAIAPSPSLSPPGALVESADLLPTEGRAIDLAGGNGDGALWMAQRGLETTLVDVSDVALDAARERAIHIGVDLMTAHVDLELEPAPDGPWDLISCSHYLNRPLLRRLPGLLAPDGIVVVGIATTTNLERHDRPSERFLLSPDELPTLLGTLRPLRSREDWSTWGVHEARFVGQNGHRSDE